MKLLAAIVLFLSLTACTYVADRYSTSADNVLAAKSWTGITLNVGSFTDGENLSGPTCNYKGPINTVDGESYAQYIQHALVTDLKFAGVYSETAPVTISGVLKEISNSTVTGTDWTLVVELTSSTGKSITLREDYDYNGSVFGTADSTCGSAAAAFMPAVQNLVGKIIQEAPESLM